MGVLEHVQNALVNLEATHMVMNLSQPWWWGRKVGVVGGFGTEREMTMSHHHQQTPNPGKTKEGDMHIRTGKCMLLESTKRTVCRCCGEGVRRRNCMPMRKGKR